MLDSKGCRRDPGELPEGHVKVANLKVKVRCGSIDSANGAEGRTNLGPCAIGDAGPSGQFA